MSVKQFHELRPAALNGLQGFERRERLELILQRIPYKLLLATNPLHPGVTNHARVLAIELTNHSGLAGAVGVLSVPLGPSFKQELRQDPGEFSPEVLISQLGQTGMLAPPRPERLGEELRRKLLQVLGGTSFDMNLGLCPDESRDGLGLFARRLLVS